MRAMSYEDFLNRVIEDGKSAVRADYANPKDRDKLEGALEGLEACRGRSYPDMPNLLQDAEKRAQEAFLSDSGGYWRARCRASEIEWICNVVSAAMSRIGHGTIVPPTARGMMEAIHVLADRALLISDEYPTKGSIPCV